MKTTEPGNSTDYRSGRSLSVIQTNSDQLWWPPDAFALIWKKEETLVLIRKENDPRIWQNRGVQTGNFP